MIHRTTGVLTVSILLAVSPLTAEDQVSGSAPGMGGFHFEVRGGDRIGDPLSIRGNCWTTYTLNPELIVNREVARALLLLITLSRS